MMMKDCCLAQTKCGRNKRARREESGVRVEKFAPKKWSHVKQRHVKEQERWSDPSTEKERRADN